jgi:hypothetical protein
MSRRRGGHAVYAILLDLPRRDFRYAEVTEQRIEVQACPNLVAFDPTLAPLPLGDDVIRRTCDGKLAPKSVSELSRAHRERPPRMLIEFCRDISQP